MVELSVEGNHLHVEILGWDKFLGLKSSINVPLKAIKSVSKAAGLPKFQWTDVRVLGTGIPRKIAVGTHWIGFTTSLGISGRSEFIEGRCFYGDHGPVIQQHNRRGEKR